MEQSYHKYKMLHSPNTIIEDHAVLFFTALYFDYRYSDCKHPYYEEQDASFTDIMINNIKRYISFFCMIPSISFNQSLQNVPVLL